MVKICFMCRRPPEKGSLRSYHNFPYRDTERRSKWFQGLGVKPVVTRVLFLCSDHFTSEDFYFHPQGRRALKKSAVPTNFSESVINCVSESTINRFSTSSPCSSDTETASETESRLPIEHINIESPFTSCEERVNLVSESTSCEEQSDSHLDFQQKSEKSPLLQQNDNGSDMIIYCRMCLNPVDKNQMICLGAFHDIKHPYWKEHFKKNKIVINENFIKMIRIVMPNFDHALVYNPVMCNDCSTHLQVAFDFVEQCMETQSRIQQFKNKNCPWKKMVNCEEVVRNKTQLPTSSAEVPLNPKKRKLEELLSAKCVEQPCEPQTVLPDEEFETIIIKMEENEESEQKNYDIIQEEICYIKEDFDEGEHQIQTEDAIRTNVAIRTQSEHSLPAIYVAKSACSITTPGVVVVTKNNSENQFPSTDVSCNVKSTVNNSSYVVRKSDLPSQLSSTVPCPKSSNPNVVVPKAYITLVNPKTFSSVKSQFQNSQNR